MSIRSMSEQEIEELRDEVAILWKKRARGDLPERAFQKESEKHVLDLCRLLAHQRIGQHEEIQVEHHVARAHTKIASSVLRESEQEFISLLATEHRLFRLRTMVSADRPALFRDDDKDPVEELAFSSASGVVVRRQLRAGEIVAGVVIAIVGMLGRPWLEVTSTALVVLGVAGALHGLVLPTRWAEVRTTDGRPPFEIWALRKKSARRLVRFLRRRIAGG